jgi:membrane protease YdiL (CAAX protease family)
VLFAVFLVGAAGEEVAWSATLLEPLQARYGALAAGLVIGVFAAIWHVVPFCQAHPVGAWILGQCVFTVAFRLLLAWIYNASGRSLGATVIGHAAYNTAWQLFPNNGSGYEPWITAAVTCILALVVVGLYGPATLGGRYGSDNGR